MSIEEKEKICICGCEESMHVDGCEHCACCVDCREFEENPVCEFCEGTGEIETTETDPDSHQQIPSGTRPCHCQMKEETDNHE